MNNQRDMGDPSNGVIKVQEARTATGTGLTISCFKKAFEREICDRNRRSMFAAGGVGVFIIAIFFHARKINE